MSHPTISPATLLALFAGSAASALAPAASAQSTQPFPAQFQLSSLATGNGADGFAINGVDSSDLNGRSVSSAGDVNGDGIDDLIIGAQRATVGGASTGAGGGYVVFGRDLAPFVCAADTNGDGVLDNGDIGFFVTLFLAGDTAADFNGDGILDNGDISAFVAAFLAGC